MKAFVTLTESFKMADKEQLANELQEHTKKVTAPYKYPRKVRFSFVLMQKIIFIFVIILTKGIFSYFYLLCEPLIVIFILFWTNIYMYIREHYFILPISCWKSYFSFIQFLERK